MSTSPSGTRTRGSLLLRLSKECEEIRYGKQCGRCERKGAASARHPTEPFEAIGAKVGKGGGRKSHSDRKA
jgi:hypothetical protein